MKILLLENRTINYINQVIGSFLFKFLAIACSFITVPLMIKYLGNELYGIWATFLSLASWIVLFDVGIGNGLKNKISELLANNLIEDVKKYISTSYIVLGFISFGLLVLFLVISNYVNWQIIFNSSILSNNDFKNIVNIFFFFILLNFWLGLINQIFNGYQRTSLVVFNQFLSNLLVLIFTYILYIYFEKSLYKLSLIYGLSLMITNLSLSFWFFFKNKEIIPSSKFFDITYVKSISSLGLKFFIIQIAVIVIFTTDKILIIQLFGPQHVTTYDVVFKLFSVITLIHSLISMPLWPAYTDAYYKGDVNWIKKMLFVQLKLYMFFTIATIILIISAKRIIQVWIGDVSDIDNMLIIAIGIFTIISIWNNIFAYFVNAINKIELQLKISIISMFINIPLSIILVKHFHTGVYGIVIATCFSLSLFALLGPVQVLYIIKRKKTGVCENGK